MDDIRWLNRGITTDRTKPWATCPHCRVKVQGAHTCRPENLEATKATEALTLRLVRRRGLGRGLADSLEHAGVELEN